MNSKVALKILSLVVLLVVALGHEGGPLSRMSGSSDGDAMREPEPEQMASATETVVQPVSRTVTKSWVDEPIHQSASVKFDNPATFGDQQDDEFSTAGLWGEDPAPKPKTRIARNTERVRSTSYHRSQMPAGKVDLDFDPRLEWTKET